MADIKIVVMGKPGFENWEDCILKNTSLLFRTIRNPLQGTERIVVNNVTSQKQKFLIVTLVEDMKPVVAVKKDFACRDESKVMACFIIFGLSRFRCKEKINGVIFH